MVSKPLTVQKFNRLKCLHGTDYLFDSTEQKIDLDFAGRKFVRLARSRVNKTPKRTNF